MKRLIAMLIAVLMLIGVLCACDSNTAEKAESKTDKAASNVKEDVKDAIDKPTEAIPETVIPTETDGEVGDMIETIADAAATEWDDMVENGEVDDGDGNVGDRENDDGDGNTAE